MNIQENFDSPQGSEEIFIEIVEDETELLDHPVIGALRY